MKFKSGLVVLTTLGILTLGQLVQAQETPQVCSPSYDTTAVGVTTANWSGAAEQLRTMGYDLTGGSRAVYINLIPHHDAATACGYVNLDSEDGAAFIVNVFPQGQRDFETSFVEVIDALMARRANGDVAQVNMRLRWDMRTDTSAPFDRQTHPHVWTWFTDVRWENGRLTLHSPAGGEPPIEVFNIGDNTAARQAATDTVSRLIAMWNSAGIPLSNIDGLNGMDVRVNGQDYPLQIDLANGRFSVNGQDWVNLPAAPSLEATQEATAEATAAATATAVPSATPGAPNPTATVPAGTVTADPRGECVALHDQNAQRLEFATPQALAEALAARDTGITEYVNYITANNCIYVNFDPSDGAAFVLINAKGLPQNNALGVTDIDASIEPILRELQRLRDDGLIAKINMQFIAETSETLVTQTNGAGNSSANTFVRFWFSDVQLSDDGTLTLPPPRDPNARITVFSEGGDVSFAQAGNAITGWLNSMANAGFSAEDMPDLQGMRVRLAAGGGDGRSGRDAFFTFSPDGTTWNLTSQRYNDIPQTQPQGLLNDWSTVPQPPAPAAEAALSGQSWQDTVILTLGDGTRFFIPG